jgi:hypothetical protein
MTQYGFDNLQIKGRFLDAKINYGHSAVHGLMDSDSRSAIQYQLLLNQTSSDLSQEQRLPVMLKLKEHAAPSESFLKLDYFEQLPIKMASDITSREAPSSKEDDLSAEISRKIVEEDVNGFDWPKDLQHVIARKAMVILMKSFGPEGVELWRKDFDNLSDESLVRLFKRWNPHFFTWFHQRLGMWVPVLGFREEHKRRETVRSALRNEKRDQNVVGA